MLVGQLSELALPSVVAEKERGKKTNKGKRVKNKHLVTVAFPNVVTGGERLKD